jgi:hypothetical protein
MESKTLLIRVIITRIKDKYKNDLSATDMETLKEKLNKKTPQYLRHLVDIAEFGDKNLAATQGGLLFDDAVLKTLDEDCTLEKNPDDNKKHRSQKVEGFSQKNIFTEGETHTSEQAIIKMLNLEYSSFQTISDELNELDKAPPWDFKAELQFGILKAIFSMAKSLLSELESDLHDFVEGTTDEFSDEPFQFDIDYKYISEERHISKKLDENGNTFFTEYDYSKVEIGASSLNDWALKNDIEEINNAYQLLPLGLNREHSSDVYQQIETSKKTIAEQKVLIAEFREQLLHSQNAKPAEAQDQPPTSVFIHENTSDHFKTAIEANNKFWKLYNKEDESTAPLKDTVKEWLVSKGYTASVAKSIDTVLRGGRKRVGGKPKS